MEPTPDIEYETLAAFGQLVASVAHKLNNDLTAARGYSDLLDEDLRELAGGDERLKDVAEQAQSLRTEIHSASNAVQLLAAFAMGRRVPGVQTPAAVLNQVVSVVGASLRGAGIAVERDVDDSLPALPDATTTLFQRTIMLVLLVCQQNLANAPGQRCVRVSVQAADSGGIRVGVSHAGPSSDEERAAKRLAASAALVQESGGRLTARHDAGETTYVMELPA